MKILTLTVILGLPLMALGQTEPQQTQEQTKETQTTAPTKGKKMRPAQEQTNPQAKPETGTNAREQTNVKGHAPDVNRNQPGMHSSTSTSQTNATTGQKTVGSTSQTTVNKQEFRSRHTE